MHEDVDVHSLIREACNLIVPSIQSQFNMDIALHMKNKFYTIPTKYRRNKTLVNYSMHYCNRKLFHKEIGFRHRITKLPNLHKYMDCIQSILQRG